MPYFLNQYTDHTFVDKLFIKTKLEDSFGTQNAHSKGIRSLMYCNLIPDYDMGCFELCLLASICKIELIMIVFIYTHNKNSIAACKICLNSQAYSPTIPRIYPFLISIFPIKIETCIALDKNNKIHLLISNDAEKIIHNKTQYATDDVLRWHLQQEN